jgi:hypothetical protein
MEIMQANNLFAASTSFAPAKSAPLGQATYRPKNKNQKPAQLDYCLISNRWKSSARSCKVEWRHSIHRHLRLYDHGMVVVKFSLKIKRSVKREPKPDFTWLTEKENKPTFDQAYLTAKSAAGTPAKDTSTETLKTLSSALLSAVKSVVPGTKRAKTKRRERSERTIGLFKSRASKLQGLS